MSYSTQCIWWPRIGCLLWCFTIGIWRMCLYDKLNNGQFGTRFVAAKARVAPLKELSIPRLQMQGAALASRLGKSILQESRLNFEKVRYLSDSCVALAWIQRESRIYKPFVSCRVSEIQSNSSPEDWSHCPTKLNVADYLTKGIAATEVNGRWFHGQEFIQLPKEHWPEEKGEPDMTEVNKERSDHMRRYGSPTRYRLSRVLNMETTAKSDGLCCSIQPQSPS